MLVCLEDRQEWLPASRIADLAPSIERLRSRWMMPAMPPPPPPERPPSLTPLQGDFFGEASGQAQLFDPGTNEDPSVPKASFSFEPVGETDRSSVLTLPLPVTNPIRFLYGARAQTPVISMAPAVETRVESPPVVISLPIIEPKVTPAEPPKHEPEPLPDPRRNFFRMPPRRTSPVPIEIEELEPIKSFDPQPSRPPAVIPEESPFPPAWTTEPLLNESVETSRQNRWLPWVGAAIALLAIVLFLVYWTIDHSSSHSAIAEAARQRVLKPIAMSGNPPSLSPMSGSRQGDQADMQPLSGGDVRPSESEVQDQTRDGISAGASSGNERSLSPSVLNDPDTDSSLLPNPGTTPGVGRTIPAGISRGTSSVKEHSQNPMLKNDFDTDSSGLPHPTTVSRPNATSSIDSGKVFSSASSSVDRRKVPKARNKSSSQKNSSKTASTNANGVSVNALGSAGAVQANDLLPPGLAVPATPTSSLARTPTSANLSTAKNSPSAMSKASSGACTSESDCDSPSAVSNGPSDEASKTAASKPTATGGRSAFTAVPVPSKTSAIETAQSKPQATNAALPAVIAPIPVMPPVAADPWAGRQTEAIDLVIHAKIIFGKSTVGTEAAAMLAQMHQKEILHAVATGERLYLPDKANWSATREEKSYYRVFLNFSGLQANGERAQSTAYQFQADLQDKSVTSDDQNTRHDFFAAPAPLVFKHDPLADDVELVLGAVDLLNKQKLKAMIIQNNRHNKAEIEKISKGLANAQQKLDRNVGYFRGKYPEAALQNIGKAYEFSGLIKPHV